MILPKTIKSKIFVTTGSALEFDLLSKIIDIINKNKKYSVIIQIGKGNYKHKNCKYFKFTKDIDKYYDWADLVITHTGAGTLTELIINNKKVISISNPKGYDAISEIAIEFDKLKFIKYLSFYKIKNNYKYFIKIIVDILNNKIEFKKYYKKKENIGTEIMSFLI